MTSTIVQKILNENKSLIDIASQLNTLEKVTEYASTVANNLAHVIFDEDYENARPFKTTAANLGLDTDDLRAFTKAVIGCSFCRAMKHYSNAKHWDEAIQRYYTAYDKLGRQLVGKSPNASNFIVNSLAYISGEVYARFYSYGSDFMPTIADMN